jgi:hypothetical protein
MTPSFTPNLGKVAKLSYGVVDRSLLRIVFVGEEIERGLVDLSVLRITVATVKYLVYACVHALPAEHGGRRDRTTSDGDTGTRYAQRGHCEQKCCFIQRTERRK